MPQITVPDLGDFHDVEIIDVLVKPGDKIDVDTPLLTLETEKATMDVPSSGAGTVKSIAVKKGDRVSKGSVILEVEEAVGGSRSAVSAPRNEQPVAAAAESPKPKATEPSAAGASSPASAPTAKRQPPTASSEIAVPDLG